MTFTKGSKKMNKNTWENISKIKDNAIWELGKLVDEIICKSNISNNDFYKYNKLTNDIIFGQISQTYKEIFKD